MSLSLGYLTPKQKTIWDLKSSGMRKASIARKLGITRQTVQRALDMATLKVGEALEEAARINNIQVSSINPSKGFLRGYSPHFKAQAFVTFSAKNGVQVWYRHDGDCEKCSRLEQCRQTLLSEAKDRNFLIHDDTSNLPPSKLAEALFTKITGD